MEQTFPRSKRKRSKTCSIVEAIQKADSRHMFLSTCPCCRGGLREQSSSDSMSDVWPTSGCRGGLKSGLLGSPADHDPQLTVLVRSFLRSVPPSRARCVSTCLCGWSLLAGAESSQCWWGESPTVDVAVDVLGEMATWC
jgi:hypothetical protein